MATLAKLLQVDMGLPEMAERLAAAGRGKDTILAHINPTEARLLKSRGGSGKINPKTGIMEFDEAGIGDAYQYTQDDYSSPPEFAQPTPPPADRSSGDEVSAYPISGIVGKTPTEAGTGDEVSAYPTAGIVGKVPAQAGPANNIPAAGPSSPAPAASAAQQSGQLPTPSPELAAEFNKQTSTPAGGGFMEGLKSFGNNLTELNKALSPLTPYLKGGVALAGAAQGNKASQQMQQQAAANEAEIRGLAEPYKQRGQQLIDLGQAGGLTSAQQKQLETQRAVAAQQMASSGVTGGTAQQQLEANLQNQAAAFAQQNIDQGMKLMGIADDYITKAMSTGYAENKDAQSLAMDFYKAIGQFLEPQAGTGVGQANAAPK